MTERPADGVDLEAAARDHLSQWELRPDGEPTRGSSSLVLPVRTSAGASAVLKVGLPDAESQHEHLVLRQWGGTGAVRLLRADPRHRVLLLERLRSASLQTLSDVDACAVVAGLYARIHVPPMPQLRSLTTQVEEWTDEFRGLARNAPIPRRLVEQAIVLSVNLAADPPVATVLHGNLHYSNVLAADRSPWLAIAPRPLNGDPHYELAPMLVHRWDELAGQVRDRVRARFHTLVDVAGLDEERARAWVIVRVVHEATRELSRARAGTGKLTQYVAVAKAVQD